MATYSSEELHRLYERFDEIVYNRGDIDRFDEVVAEGFQHHAPIPTPDGREGFKEFHRQFHAAFPDHTSTTEVAVAEGDKICVVYTARATHQGEFAGIPPTGNQVEVKGISTYRFDEEGKATDEWANPDMLGMMQQLGVAPSPDES